MPRFCACGCGQQLTGAQQQRRHTSCRRDARIARNRRWREKARQEPDYLARQAARAMRRYNADPEAERKRMRDRSRERHARDRKAALDAYGGKCVCCGETRKQFLTLQHKNGDGHLHRKEVVGKHHRVGVGAFIRRLRKAGFPKQYAIQVACWNCHMAHDHYGACPHKT